MTTGYPTSEGLPGSPDTWATARQRGCVHARNDVLVGSLPRLGFALARWRLPAADSWLAIVVALYLAIAGVRLARQNLGLVMSPAAPEARRDELARLAARVEGVSAIDALIATWAGAALHVYVEIAVDGATSVRVAHDIAHAGEARLAGEVDVARVVVHVGPANDEVKRVEGEKELQRSSRCVGRSTPEWS